MWHKRMIRLHDADILGPSIHRTVARTIIQSEALYSVTVGATLASYVARSDIFYVGSCMVPPLVVRLQTKSSSSHIFANADTGPNVQGISFTLIITHVGFDDIKREISAANNADLSKLDFQRVVDSSGGDSLGSIVAPSTLVLSASCNPEKGEALDGVAKRDASTFARTRAGVKPDTTRV